MLRSVWAQRSLCILSHFHASPARFGGQASCQCCYCVCRAPSILLHKVIVRLENNIQHCKGHSFLRPGKFPCISKEKSHWILCLVMLNCLKAKQFQLSIHEFLIYGSAYSVSQAGVRREGRCYAGAVTLCFSQLVFRSRGSIRGAAPGAAPGARRGPAGNFGRAPGAHGASDTWWSPFGSARALPPTLPLQTGSPAPRRPSALSFHQGDVISG